ncbi:hypothetical protein EON81_14465 [bacterium]|nr:MAG: hypothetical protein EON81_14465 [bacterium]
MKRFAFLGLLAVFSAAPAQTYLWSQSVNHATWGTYNSAGTRLAYGDGLRTVVKLSEGGALFDGYATPGVTGNPVAFGGQTFTIVQPDGYLGVYDTTSGVAYAPHYVSPGNRKLVAISSGYSSSGRVAVAMVPTASGFCQVYVADPETSALGTRFNVAVAPSRFRQVEISGSNVVVPGPQVYSLTGVRRWGASQPGLFDVSPDGTRIANLYGTHLSVYNLSTGALLWSRSVRPTPESTVRFTGDGSGVTIIRDDANELYRMQTFRTTTGALLSGVATTPGYPALLDISQDSTALVAAGTEVNGLLPQAPWEVGLDPATGEALGARNVAPDELVGDVRPGRYYVTLPRGGVLRDGLVAYDPFLQSNRILDLEDGSVVKTFAGQATGPGVLSPNGLYLANPGPNGLSIVRLSDGAQVAYFANGGVWSTGYRLEEWQGDKLIVGGNAFRISSSFALSNIASRGGTFVGYTRNGTVRVERLKTFVKTKNTGPFGTPESYYKYELKTYLGDSTTPASVRSLAYETKQNISGFLSNPAGIIVAGAGVGNFAYRVSATGATSGLTSFGPLGMPNAAGTFIFTEKGRYDVQGNTTVQDPRSFTYGPDTSQDWRLATDGETVVRWGTQATDWNTIFSNLHLTRW